jgi:tetratricopeptide (TPR) repeat protein
MRAAEYYYEKALQIQPNSGILIDRFTVISNFLTGYNNFVDGVWVEAQENLSFVYEKDPGFAGGLVDVLLYETYTIIAKLYEEQEFYVSAKRNYESAAVIAYNNPDNELRIFEVAVNLARMDAKYGDFRASSFQFQDAMEDSGFYALSQFHGGDFGENIAIAYENININFYYTAYLYFTAAIEETPEFISHNLVWLQEGETIAKLSLEHSTTFSYIFEFNDFNYSMLPISTGTGIIVPSLP